MGRHKQQSLLLCNLQLSTGLERMLKDLPNPGIEPGSSALQADSLPAEPPGKPRNTRVGSLSLLQQIFLTQELNQGPPALQVDSLPAELLGKLIIILTVG